MSLTVGIDEIAPRQLAPSVGTAGAGIASTMASTPAIYDSSTAEESIYFSPFCFTPHSLAQLPIFNSLHHGVDLTV
jgi:hypothetical protein